MSTVLTAPDVTTVRALVSGRRRRARRRGIIVAALAVAVAAVFAISLMVGDTFYTPEEVWRVLIGQTVPGASFTVGDLRLPRAVLATLAGFAFGAAGVTFQTMLRNPLASPDVIGISSGASAAAVVGIVLLNLDAVTVSFLALAGALVTAAGIYLLAHRGGFAGTRLILIGIGVAAMLDSVITYALSKAASWDLQAAMRWLTGSLNAADWPAILPLAIAFALLVPMLLSQSRTLSTLRLGDDTATGLGVHTHVTRIIVLVAAVALLAFATSAAGPIAFVAFMSGPIAARLVGPSSALLPASGLVGALLVLVADLVGQFAFDHRYPVGVITGVLGAPFLIFLLIRLNRSGASL
ncbi:iron ABC transporter permease [Microbacterium horticulturae]|uniref:Iron ABC transporter permease n=1 Tax=Microbacterium horticulturae TaxID=3028316 RepID=A0ABY8C6K6_9MICO|nr:iron ABC transporter permease [Microbacterium sp. KACC 23027]WEG10233.1 iron ABC transporter permease [Microbacterium sp. KACC 23027]